MKLHECSLGRMVITIDSGMGIEIGHIVGLTYNCRLADTGRMTSEEKISRTIPLVRFPDGERGVHHANLEPYTG